jgi:hypothetical protein
MPDTEQALRQLLAANVPAAFFERARQELAAPRSVGFRALFASVPRRLGAGAQLKVEPPAAVAAARSHWTLGDYARLWLLLNALPHLPAVEHADFVLELFEAGELGEQVSILRTLAALPGPGRFVEIGLQACRHNSLDVFEAIVAENPFLTQHFPVQNLNQAIMKATFQSVALKRVEGLESHIGSDLVRMATDYASERRAAGRPVPEDVEYLGRYGAK